jgi:Peptidase family M28
VPAAAQVRYQLVKKDILMQRLASAPLKNEDREQALVEMFASVGCKAELEQLPHSKLANVICVLPGTSTDTMIVGGHFDKVDRGKGIVDDWSGASMLPSLYQSLKDRPRRHTIIFIGFAEEEKGLIGSKYYVKEMTDSDRGKTKEMINLECLGMNPTEVWASHSDPKLLNALFAVAKAMKIPLSIVNVEKVGTADSESFAAMNIPRTTIHSVDQQTFAVLHSDRDNITAIHPDEYYESYRLIAAYLAIADDGLDRAGGATRTVSAPSGKAVELHP